MLGWLGASGAGAQVAKRGAVAMDGMLGFVSPGECWWHGAGQSCCVDVLGVVFAMTGERLQHFSGGSRQSNEQNLALQPLELL